MSGSDSRQHFSGGEVLVDFMARFTASEQFHKVFQEGMSLVEETAAYLDGPGRREVRGLGRQGAIAYATESMRLTTRLMQLASWLLLQRAVSAGELTREAAEAEKERINLGEIGAGHDIAGAERLPGGLNDLVARSLRLHERVVTLDAMVRTAQAGMREARSGVEPAANPVANQMDRLAQTFARSRTAG
jgi:regulator of CtrA degradation